jgi:hypothetical protein
VCVCACARGVDTSVEFQNRGAVARLGKRAVPIPHAPSEANQCVAGSFHLGSKLPRSVASLFVTNHAKRQLPPPLPPASDRVVVARLNAVVATAAAVGEHACDVGFSLHLPLLQVQLKALKYVVPWNGACAQCVCARARACVYVCVCVCVDTMTAKKKTNTQQRQCVAKAWPRHACHSRGQCDAAPTAAKPRTLTARTFHGP